MPLSNNSHGARCTACARVMLPADTWRRAKKQHEGKLKAAANAAVRKFLPGSKGSPFWETPCR
jgi:hypothetical protein